LGHDVRGQLRAADAEGAFLHLAYRRAGPEGELHGAIEVGSEVDVAHFAVGSLLHLLQRRTALLHATTEGTQKIPPEIEESSAGCLQAELERLPAWYTPRVRERVGP
jgi:hypothetical protein